MMMCEFIEKTGFEPTAAEYADIEAEYMGCDIDKDKFCKQWVKNGGIQRLSRIRVRRIEELEQQLATMQKKYDDDMENLRAEHRRDIEYYEQEDARKRVAYEQAIKERNAANATVEAIRNLL